jgi:hypothetical protein
MSVPGRIMSDRQQKEIWHLLEECVIAVQSDVCFVLSLKTEQAICMSNWNFFAGKYKSLFWNLSYSDVNLMKMAFCTIILQSNFSLCANSHFHAFISPTNYHFFTIQ